MLRELHLFSEFFILLSQVGNEVIEVLNSAIESVKAHLLILLLVEVDVDLLLEILKSSEELILLCLGEFLPIPELLHFSGDLLETALVLGLPPLCLLLKAPLLELLLSPDRLELES